MLQLGRHRGRQLVFGPFSFFLEFLGSFLVGLFFLDFLGSFCWHVTRSWQSGDSCWPRHPSLSLSTQGSRHSANSLISSTLIPILLFFPFSYFPIWLFFHFTIFPILLFSYFAIFPIFLFRFSSIYTRIQTACQFFHLLRHRYVGSHFHPRAHRVQYILAHFMAVVIILPIALDSGETSSPLYFFRELFGFVFLL